MAHSSAAFVAHVSKHAQYGARGAEAHFNQAPVNLGEGEHSQSAACATNNPTLVTSMPLRRPSGTGSTLGLRMLEELLKTSAQLGVLIGVCFPDQENL